MISKDFGNLLLFLLENEKKIKYFEGTHPLPSEQNIEATKQILEMLKGVTEKDIARIAKYHQFYLEIQAKLVDFNKS